MFTAAEKLKCAEREVGQRKHVYARRVEAGKMSKAQVDREVDLMQAIANDYRRQVESERLL